MPSSEDDTVVEDDHVRRAVQARLFDVDRGPVRVGKYAIERSIGSGAMGHVYAARDADLDRLVAVKLLREARSDNASTARLRREAQAMAQVSHPNVAEVFDAGVDRGKVFLALALVTGGDLRMWQEQERTWQEIVAMYRQAAAGLAAVHRAGIVHRDFKPANVLVTEEGIPKVTDFGLAGLLEGTDISGDAVATSAGSSWDATLSVTGKIVGTPRYMAPEVHQARPATAASDQFAFCVALFEALHGKPPFSGGNLHALGLATAAGRIEMPASGPRVPPWLDRVIRRGLSPDPDDRWPSMEDLRDALQPPRSKRGLVAAVVGLLVVAAGVWALWPDPCDAASARWNEAWGDTRRAALISALEEQGGGATVVEVMDRYAAEGGAMQHEACAAQDDAAATCLGRARAAFAALASVYAEGPGSGVARARLSVGQLPALTGCVEGRVGAEPQPPAELVPEVARLRDRLFGAAMEVMATGDASRLGLVEAVLGEAEAIGFEPAIAEAEYQLGITGLATGVVDRGEAALLAAYERAMGLRYDAVAMEAAARLAAHAAESGAPDARRWMRQGQALVDRVDARDAFHANALFDLATAAAKQGDPARARELHEQALAIREEIRGADHYEVAFSLAALAQLDAAAGRGDESRQRLERAFAILDRDLRGTPPWAQVKAALGK